MMPSQDFFAPTDLKQACSLLATEEHKALVIAGGTDLMVRFNRYRRKRTEVLVYLGKLGLDYILEEDNHIIIGSCATLASITASAEVQRRLPLLARACGQMASLAVRNAATLGGNVANGSRNADGIPALMALGAEVVMSSADGQGRMPIERFVLSPKKKTLGRGGLIKEFRIPCLDGADRWTWKKLKQRQGDSRSIVSLAARIRMAGPVCENVRLVLGAMAPNPSVSRAAARILEGQALSAELIERVAEEIIPETDPISDSRATAWYRKRAAQALVRQALAQLV